MCSSPGFLDLPVELIVEIVLHLSSADICQVCQVSSQLAPFRWDWKVWSMKAWHKFTFPLDLFRSTHLTDPRQRYWLVKRYCQNPNVTLNDVIGSRLECTDTDPRFKWDPATPEDRAYQDRLFRFLVGRGAHGCNFSPLVWASEQGDPKLIDQIMINFSPDYGVIHLNAALCGAAEGGHLEIVQDLVRRGATHLKAALDRAIHSNHLPVIQYLVSEGPADVQAALTLDRPDSHNWLLSFHHPMGQININRALSKAADRGHLETVQYLVNHGATDLNRAAMAAADQGHLELVTWFFDHGATDYERSLQAAARSGHLEIVKYLVEQGAPDFERAIQNASDYKQDHVLAYLLSFHS